MKNIISILSTVFLITTGCGGGKQTTDELITVDVTKTYPKKELILQDFMDVEYIPLETSEDFICQDLVLDIGKNLIVLRNNPEDGNIYIFSRTGKALKKINRKGQGAEEYTRYRRAILDEDKAEIFINDQPSKKLIVYDLEGNYKRSLHRDDDINFVRVLNYDRDNLICNNHWIEDKHPFVIISKQDGRVTREIQVPFIEKVQINVLFQLNNMNFSSTPATYNPLLQNHDNWILVEQSTDTVYKYLPNHEMKPIIVRTPAILSMKPKEVFLFLNAITDQYYFMEAAKKEYNTTTHDAFPSTDLIYDKQAKAIYEYSVYNADYTDKRAVNMKGIPINADIASCQSLDVPQLLEDYENGKLKGKLKEIAATLNEESNPVLMLFKHK